MLLAQHSAQPVRCANGKLKLLAQGLAAPDAVLVDDAAWDARFAELRPVYDEKFASLRT